MPVDRRLALCVLVLGLFVAGPLPALAPPSAHAQEEGGSPEERQRASDAAYSLGVKQLRRGAYFDALKDLKEALEFGPGRSDARIAMAEAHAEMGELDKAIEILSLVDDDALAQTRRAEYLIDRGRLDDAEQAVNRSLGIDAEHVPAHWLRGRLHELHGRRVEAIEAYTEANKVWARKDVDSVDDLLANARSRLAIYALTDEYKVSLESVLDLLDQAWKKDEERNDVQVEIGLLFLSNYKDNFAKDWFKRVQTRNTQHAPGLYAAALQRAFRYESDEATELCERSVRANPQYLPPRLYLAQVALGDADLDKAREQIDACLAVNPRSLEALGARAALRYIDGDSTGFEAQVNEIAALDKFANDAFVVVARALEEQRRFAEAHDMALKATAIDDRDAAMWFLAGRNALNIGKDAEGKGYLEKSEKIDPFKNIYRWNFIELLTKVDGFSVRRGERFMVKIPPAEDAPYGRLVENGLNWSLDLLLEKWKFEPEYPLFISIFDKQDDFATRTIGLPGFPALGACFGRVVTLDSPRALPPGAFGWRATLHHELAHVITLELSRGRVPRWLTEGISVYEERKVTPIWDREMERALVNAIASDDVLTLDNVNNAFRGPRVLYAYYQGGLMCELIERDFGFDKLREMVRLYGEGRKTPQAVREALGVEPAEFDRRFLAYAKEFVSDLKVLRGVSDNKMKKLRRHVRSNKDDVEAQLLYAEGKVAEGKSSDALAALSAVVAVQPDHPRVLLLRALISFKEQRPDKGVEYGMQAIAAGEDLWELRMALVEHELGQPGAESVTRAKGHLRKAIELWRTCPIPTSPRIRLARMLMGEGEAALPEAIGLLREHVAISEDDVGTRAELAEYYATKGDAEGELQMLEELRDVVPLPNLQGRGGGWTRERAMDLHERLGRIYTQRKRYADAELSLDIAVEVARMPLQGAEPADNSYLSDLLTAHAEALRSLGRADDARAKAREALRLDAENDAAQDLLDQLGS